MIFFSRSTLMTVLNNLVSLELNVLTWSMISLVLVPTDLEERDVRRRLISVLRVDALMDSASTNSSNMSKLVFS